MQTIKIASKHLLLISISALILFVSFSLTLINPESVYVQKTFDQPDGKSLIPLLSNTDNYPLFTAQNIFAIDLDSSVVLYQKNPDEAVYPASTTKMLTALVALDYYEEDEVINTGSFRTVGSNMGLVWNEDITFKNLIYGLLIHSANDAAEVLANNYPGGRDEFINAMNKKAKEIYATNSNFMNPSGLDQENHYSTARDLTRIASFAMKDERFSEIVAIESWLAEDTNKVFKHYLTNRNELLGEVEGVLGVKTGFTTGARENLVTLVERDNKRVLIALLGSQDRFSESEELIEWIFDNYTWREIDSIAQ